METTQKYSIEYKEHWSHEFIALNKEFLKSGAQLMLRMDEEQFIRMASEHNSGHGLLYVELHYMGYRVIITEFIRNNEKKYEADTWDLHGKSSHRYANGKACVLKLQDLVEETVTILKEKQERLERKQYTAYEKWELLQKELNIEVFYESRHNVLDESFDEKLTFNLGGVSTIIDRYENPNSEITYKVGKWKLTPEKTIQLIQLLSEK